jgi:uncharacterized protein YecE (DUF72 family)
VGIRVGTAGWSIPRASAHRFADEGTHLYRYARYFSCAEINSSFHRPHTSLTYAKWAASTPDDFCFAVKLPRAITHDQQLRRATPLLESFLAQSSGLGSKRGPLLVQLPPSFAFDARRAGRFFELLRARHQGPVVCEPRHPTWTEASATRLLVRFAVARVGADPPRAAGLHEPGGWSGIAYYRWHGSPRPYFSPYAPEALDKLAAALRDRTRQADAWCIFDNTGSGSAAGNAVDLRALLETAVTIP